MRGKEKDFEVFEFEVWGFTAANPADAAVLMIIALVLQPLFNKRMETAAEAAVFG